MVVGVVDGGHHWIAASGTWSRRRAIISERHIETSWHRGCRNRLGRAIKGGSQIPHGHRGSCFADYQRAGGSPSVIDIIDDCDNCVTTRSGRCRSRAIVGHIDGQTCRNRSHRDRFRRAIVGGSQVTDGRGSCCLINHERTEGRALISGIIDFSYHDVTARIGGNRGGSVVSQIHAKTLRHSGHTDGLCSTIIGDSQITKSGGGARLTE